MSVRQAGIVHGPGLRRLGDVPESGGGGGGETLTISTGLTKTGTTVTANIATGVAGGQTIAGGTGAAENLTITSTTHGTKGRINLGAAGTTYVDEAAGSLTIAGALNVGGVTTLPAGSQAAPSLRFVDSNSGFWRIGSAILGLSLNGQQIIKFYDTVMAVYADVSLSAGKTVYTPRVGGQEAVSGAHLDLISTSHATKGQIRLGGTTGLIYHEATGQTSIGTATPGPNKLTIVDAGTSWNALSCEATGAAGICVFELKASSPRLYVALGGPVMGTTIWGISRNGLGELRVNNAASGLLIGTDGATSLYLGTNGTVRMQIGSTGIITIAGVAYTFPAAQGGADTYLKNDGSGTLTWAAAGGGSGSPGGANTNVQFNNAGNFGGSANFTWDGTRFTALNTTDNTAARVASAVTTLDVPTLIVESTSATGYPSIHIRANSALQAGIRASYSGNLTTYVTSSSGGHYFTIGGDYGTGNLRLLVKEAGLYGSDLTGGNLDLSSTTHATKGSVRIGGASGLVYNEPTGDVAIGSAIDTAYRLKVYKSGSPQAFFAGTVSFTLRVGSTTETETAQIFGGANDATGTLMGLAKGNLSAFYGGTSHTVVALGGTHASSVVVIAPGNAERVRITATGVGIGGAPSQPLHITAADAVMRMTATGTGGTSWDLHSRQTDGDFRITPSPFGTPAVAFNQSSADGETALSVCRDLSGVETLQRVTQGAADSGGTGYRLLRIPN